MRACVWAFLPSILLLHRRPVIFLFCHHHTNTNRVHENEALRSALTRTLKLLLLLQHRFCQYAHIYLSILICTFE